MPMMRSACWQLPLCCWSKKEAHVGKVLWTCSCINSVLIAGLYSKTMWHCVINWTREVMKSSVENPFFYKAVENNWSNCSSSFSEISVYKSHTWTLWPGQSSYSITSFHRQSIIHVVVMVALAHYLFLIPENGIVTPVKYVMECFLKQTSRKYACCKEG